MAKVTGPLMSLTASGQLGKSIVFLKWRGIADVRKWIKPANPKTADQVTERNNFKEAVTKYHTLAGNDMLALRDMSKGKPYTGFNQWIKWIRDAFQATITWVTIKNVGASDITTSGAKISATPDASGVLKVLYGTTPGSWTGSVEEETPGGNADVAHTITLSGLSATTEYWYTVEYPLATTKEGKTGWYSFTTI